MRRGFLAAGVFSTMGMFLRVPCVRPLRGTLSRHQHQACDI